jgi:hypothetical protein
MSGSNAIAAAKRRRGGAVDNRGPPPPGSQGLNINNSVPQAPAPPIHPLQLVAMNHERLNKLSADFPKAIDTLGENFNALSSNCDYLHEKFTLLEQKVDSLPSLSDRSNVGSTVSNNVDNERLNRFESDLVELHKVVSRMQSFTMELSTNVSKSRDQLDTFTRGINERVDKCFQELESFTLNNYINEAADEEVNENDIEVNENDIEVNEITE